MTILLTRTESVIAQKADSSLHLLVGIRRSHNGLFHKSAGALMLPPTGRLMSKPETFEFT